MLFAMHFSLYCAENRIQKNQIEHNQIVKIMKNRTFEILLTNYFKRKFGQNKIDIPANFNLIDSFSKNE